MARAQRKASLIEFKGMTLPVVSVTLHSLRIESLSAAARDLFGDEAFFDGDAAVIELDRVDSSEPANAADAVDWAAVCSIFSGHGLRVIGVRGATDELRASAERAGLPSFAAFKRTSRAADESVPPTPATAETASKAQREITTEVPEQTAAAPKAAEPAPAAPSPSAPPATAVPTMVINRPLRSGQQAYARGGDLVVLAAVNPGAEVIADGSIHIYAPLRGRALAGASGDTSARIFTTRFEAELVSIAGIYRTFESGIAAPLRSKPVQVSLTGGGDAADDATLKIESLAID